MIQEQKNHPCKFCGKEIPLKKVYCNRQCYTDDHIITIKCKKCGIEFKLPKNRNHQEFCSRKCANETIDRKETHYKASQTLLKKYNTTNPFDVIGYNNIVKNPEKKSRSLKENWATRSMEEINSLKSNLSHSHKKRTPEEKQQTKIKIQKTCLEKYGDVSFMGRNSSGRDNINNNIRDNNYERLNDLLLKNNLELIEEYKGVKDIYGNIIYYQFRHVPSGSIFVDHVACGRIPIYRDINDSKWISLAEKEVADFIQENYNGLIIRNNRKLIKGFEIDIYIPDLNLAIEYNGLKWHSESNGKDRGYHLYKTEELEKQNIQLIHVFEDEWLYKKDIVKSKLLYMIGKIPNIIYARKCIIKEIGNYDKNIFLNKNHIQGEDKSKFKYGLYYNNELISVITFGSLRNVTGNKSENDIYELIRYATKLNYSIVGGFSKLLKHFVKINNPKKIISYADRRWSKGNLYIKNNFQFIHNSPPNYWYMKYWNKREHRYKYRKSELNKILDVFDLGKSEWENMKLNKYDRIWDCGSKKYEIIL